MNTTGIDLYSWTTPNGWKASCTLAELRRLYGVLDRRLADNEWLATDFSIADIANWCWCGIHNWAGVSIDDLPNQKRWMGPTPRLRQGGATTA
jgi:glutathione S-transferase